jgi:hypothetical protein
MDELSATDWSKVTDGVTQNEPRYIHDSKLYVQFYLRPILMATESDIQGRPIFKDVVHVRILVPGDKLSIVDRIASPDDKSRFATQYAKFEAGGAQEVVGTRLEVVPWMTRSKVEEYKFFNILTVEQLAGASDQVGQKFPGFHQDRERSKQFLEATTGVNARVKELEEKLARLEAKSETETEA